MDNMLHCCSMDDLSDTPEAASEFFSALGFEFSAWTDAETKAVKHTLYFQTAKEAQDAIALIRKDKQEWESFGVKLSEPSLHTLKKEDWAESWKIHFKLMEISPRLAIRPSWIDYKPKDGQKVITLDPGMSFGTGQHATTKFCLESIDAFAKDSPAPLSLLDAGCGSGILSIAAKMLGCDPVAAFDIDPEACEIAKENYDLNKVEVEVATASLEGFDAKGRKFDIVAANILSSALIAGKGKLFSLCKPGGRLILAGILSKEYGNVKAEFEQLGFKELFATTEKEWRGGAFLTPS